MKKICFISICLPNPSPMANITYLLIKDLVSRYGFEISLITYKESRKILSKDLPIKLYPFLKKESIKAIVRTLLLIKKENFDYIHIISTKFMHGRLLLIIPFLIKKFLQIKTEIVISAHEFYEFSNIKEFLVGGLYHIFLLRYVDLCLVFNEEYRRKILSKKIYNKKKEEIYFISRNVQSMKYEDITPSEIWVKKNIRPFILFFGFLRYGKGLPYLIIAFKKIQHKYPEMKLVIAGGIAMGPGTKDYYSKVKEIVSRLNLEKKVIFTNFITKPEIIELFNLAGITVYPYLSIENSGALFFALYTGKPIIASKILGFQRILSDGKDCILVNSKDSEEISKAIIKIMTDDTLRKKLEINARKTYDNNSFQKLLDDYYSLFSK